MRFRIRNEGWAGLGYGRANVFAALLASGALWAASGCGAPEGDVATGAIGDPVDATAGKSARVLAPPAPAVAPEVPDVSEIDRDRNRIDDSIDAALATSGPPDAEITVETVFSRPLQQADLDQFVAGGGTIRHVFRSISYGWVGKMKRSAVPAMAAGLGNDLLVIAGDLPIGPHLDKATRTGRVRPVWVNGFAQSVGGFSGTSTTTVAIVDTGVDLTHTDLAGRRAFWADPTGEYATATDPRGHGTHVAGIVTGTGESLGLGTTLTYTDGGNLTGVASGSGYVNAIDLFGSPLTFTSVAHWPSGGNTLLALMSGDNGAANYTQVNSVSGGNGLTDTTTFTPSATKHYSPLLAQHPTAPLLTTYAIVNTVTNYPTVDSFNTLRGVAPGCQWGAVKVFHSDGTGTNSELSIGLDDLVGLNVKVANMSLGLIPANTSSTTLRAKVNSLVANGITIVASAGNDGPAGLMSDPARAALAITVGATNDINQLTDYTSRGFTPIADPVNPPDTREDEKPDVLAPGGSPRYSDILSTDSNNTEGESTTFPELVQNDYASLHGTSMAAPFVTGASALIIQALESTGLVWSYASSTHPRLVKMLLGASATETNQLREGSVAAGANDPTLGRAAAPKDRAEGYGIINPDAAIEAVRLPYEGNFTGTSTGTTIDRRAWGRKIALNTGNIVSITLTPPATADYDLYLYSATPTAKGNPVILASSTNPGAATEQISYTAVANGTAYLFIKRVSGNGTFSVVGGVCGNGTVESNEQCDDGNQGAVDCCTSACKVANNGAVCDDGNKCTSTDVCQAGVCGGAAVVCSPLDACHDVGVCNPGTGVCSNPAKMDGASCSDGSACTQSDTCKAGACVGGNPVVCAASDQCHDIGVCNPANGTCSNPAKTNGAACNDGNTCTQSDSCQAGTCTGTNPIACAALDQCHDVGVCNPANGVCSNPAKTDGAGCNDGNACTKTDTCQAGKCTGGNAVVCVAQDQCHDPGTCDTSSGACSNPAKANGSGCNDGNACTQSDTCQAGACTGTNPVTCAALDQCHDVGVCDTASGSCSNPPKANSTPCNDGNACTQSDSCQSGTCTGASPVVCAASDQCHVVGTCNPANGVCSDPAKADGSACADGNACTQTDTCQAGSCVGSNPVTCLALDQCHDPGTCNPSNGACSNPAKTDGALCTDGNACTQVDACQAGTCVGTTPVVCAALDQCHVAGICDPQNGMCTNPAQQDGTACDDNSACTRSDTCQTGQCVGANPVVCVAKDQCHDVGACDAATGVCSDPAKTDGASCNDGDACTKTDTCVAGACTGASPVVCAALDQCHDPGTCDHASGSCSNPAKADGFTCDNQNACTRKDSCQSGSCLGTDSVTCTASDECHADGTCDPTSGTCSNPKKPDGAACSAGICSAGLCSAVRDAGADGMASTEGGASGDSGSGADGASSGLDGASSSSDGASSGHGDGSTDGGNLFDGLAGASGNLLTLQPESTSGCGCRLPSRRAPAGAYAGLLLGLLVLARRRRHAIH